MRSSKATSRSVADTLSRRLLDREEELARFDPFEPGSLDSFEKLMSGEALEALLRPAYEAGHRRALISAIEVCAYMNIVMPEWIKTALGAALWKVRHLEVRKWEDILDTPLPRGTHADALKRKRELASTIFDAVKSHREIGIPVDEDLFDRIARRLTALEKLDRSLAAQVVLKHGKLTDAKGSARISGTTVAQLYYDEKRRRERVAGTLR